MWFDLVSFTSFVCEDPSGNARYVIVYLMVVPWKIGTSPEVTKIVVELPVCPVTLEGGFCSAFERDEERRFGVLNAMEEVAMK